jgi:hypothetical protein
MICKLNKPGKYCSFWSTKCTSPVCEKVVEQCVSCKNIEDEYCSKFVSPFAKWSIFGGCSLYTERVIKEEVKHKLNPIKTSKKSKKK